MGNETILLVEFHLPASPGRSRTGLWWNIPRNLGYKIAFDKLGRRGYNPADQFRHASGRLSGTRDEPHLRSRNVGVFEDGINLSEVADKNHP